MEISIEEMKKSIPEVRGDKVPPAVGAVIWFPKEKCYEVAYRGELRKGDHGEYTLLERKLGDRKLDDCVLFTTLEPCMDRNEPKVPCARRITNARIKAVYVGIEDPDISVDGNGIKWLEDHGVQVLMYDRDLQDQIREANNDFIENGNERKQSELDSPEKSLLEASAANANYSDFSQEALSQFRSLASIEEETDSEEFKQRLLRLNVVDDRSTPTINGVILFGKVPRETIVDAVVLGTIQREGKAEETRDFDGPQVLATQEIMDWIKDKLPNPNDRSDAIRQELDRAFFQLVREGVVNAIVHRDYTLDGTKIQLIATPDLVTIKSPGKPVSPITIEQLQSLNAPMRSRNPALHYVFNRMRLAEERGLGLTSMKQTAESNGLPRPSFAWEEPYVVLTVYRSASAVVPALSDSIRDELNQKQIAGYEWLVQQDWISSADYAESQGLEKRAGTLHLKKFIELGITEKAGSGKATKYRATQ